MPHPGTQGLTNTLALLLSVAFATLGLLALLKPSSTYIQIQENIYLSDRKRDGAAHIPYTLDTCGQNSESAFVMMGNNEEAFTHILVASNSLRNLNTSGDIVLLSFTPDVPTCYREAYSRLCVRIKVVEEPIIPSQVTNSLYRGIINDIDKWWDFAKLLAFDMTDYRKVVFVDGDTMFMKDPDFFLRQPAGTWTAAPKSPFNSGMFVLSPNRSDFNLLLNLVRTGKYDLKHSWGGAFEDAEGKYRPRTYAPFYGAETTQGLFYYFYNDLKKEQHVLDPAFDYHYQGREDPPAMLHGQSAPMPNLIHFNFCPKPYPTSTDSKCPEMHRRWNELFDELHLQNCGWGGEIEPTTS